MIITKNFRSTLKSISFALCLTLLASFARLMTGPSFIESEIYPISMNKKGDILCKTRFTKNGTGARRGMPVQYGFCVITNKEILQFDDKRLEPDEIGEEFYFQQLEHWDSVFYTKVTENQLASIVSNTLKGKFSFTSCNTEVFKTDQRMPITAFEKDKGISLNQQPQKGLYGALSTEYLEEDSVHIAYDFGKVLLLNNVEDIDSEYIGARFDYYNPWITEEGEEVNIGFETREVTGVLIIE